MVFPDGSGFAIPLSLRNGFAGECAVVSPEDKGLSRFRWSTNQGGYARRGEPGRTILLHRELLGLTDPAETVDHVNRDRLDNRRENLRVCTHGENLQNLSARGGSSKYRGVSRRSGRGRRTGRPWVAYGHTSRRMVFLGTYATEEEAAEVALAFRREHMPFSTD